MTTRPAWHESAACDGADLNLFFPKSGNQNHAIAAAKDICGRCPVADQCLAFALEVEQTAPSRSFGIFGGLTPTERAALAQERSTA